MTQCRARASLLFVLLLTASGWCEGVRARSYAEVVRDVEPRMVKIYGSGGLRSLESYQSGFLISADGLILTAWSYVLDTGVATVMLSDGRRLEGKLHGADPSSELALLKVDAEGLDHFKLEDAQTLRAGSRVLAFSNLYGVATGDEPNSVQHGVVSGVTRLDARRGSHRAPYRGKVYVLDAMSNNAGAQGGALTDSRGRLAGVLGKELRDANSNVWLNYALPIASIRPIVKALIAGESTRNLNSEQALPEQSADLAALGMRLLPDVLRNTPPFVDSVRLGSEASRAGLRPDDLIVLVGGETVATQKALLTALRRIDAVDPVRLTVLRRGELVEVTLQPVFVSESPRP